MVRICASSDLQERALAFRFVVQNGARERAAIALRYDGQVYAYINECAHIPIELDFNPGDVFDLSRQFLVCSTHGAYYDPTNGLCLGGPCTGRRLSPLTVIEKDEAVWLLEEK
ncbi:Rieske 2Fe-2S domain-containing protein [Chitinibacter bivalviorum]|uniref:Rieske 2Fe-2S domain-containing protein n=1 Tax=Chitinibacter bivalviorum TaxID=2739434 RepID=A0A7H9BRA3_9NEIS|nr:Rieske 2Fe-2S domain-containing protein [Chitinibacter bivalviorum]QLG89764.1 Rieske 2Fe-2S domain-containing protein [Chitinibacter bivalviorum]